MASQCSMLARRTPKKSLNQTRKRFQSTATTVVPPAVKQVEEGIDSSMKFNDKIHTSINKVKFIDDVTRQISKQLQNKEYSNKQQLQRDLIDDMNDSFDANIYRIENNGKFSSILCALKGCTFRIIFLNLPGHKLKFYKNKVLGHQKCFHNEHAQIKDIFKTDPKPRQDVPQTQREILPQNQEPEETLDQKKLVRDLKEKQRARAKSICEKIDADLISIDSHSVRQSEAEDKNEDKNAAEYSDYLNQLERNKTDLLAQDHHQQIIITSLQQQQQLIEEKVNAENLKRENRLIRINLIDIEINKCHSCINVLDNARCISQQQPLLEQYRQSVFQH